MPTTGSMPVSSNRLLAALRPQAPPDPGGSVLPTDMAYWGGQRLYGALARAPKTAERRSGPALPETCGRKKLPHGSRSEEHTSELQSLMRISYAVFCLKKKKN